MRKACASIVALLLLSACDIQVNDGDEAADMNMSAEGKSADNVLSISAPGVDMKIDIPESVRSGADVEGGGEDGSVELRFTTPDDILRVAQWYQAVGDDRSSKISCAPGGEEFLFSCRKVEEGESFKLRLQPSDGGGTEGVLVLQAG